MQEKLMKQTTIFTCLFAIVAIVGMMSFAMGRECVYVVAKEETIQQKSELSDIIRKIEFKEEKEELLLQKETTEVAHFTIPLPPTLTDSEVIIENNYIGHKLYINMAGVEKDFYKKHPLKTTNSNVLAAFIQYHKGITRIELQLDRLYEHNAVIKNSNVYLNFSNPRENYEKIVVLDAGHGGADNGIVVNEKIEKEITLKVTQRLKEKLEADGIKVYLTRNDDRAVTDEDRVNLPNQLNADFFLSLHTASSENKQEFGIRALYNADYFIPHFGSIELADLIERGMVFEGKTKALGLATIEDDYEFLNKIIIPAAIIEIGYLSNEIEGNMLLDEKYIEQITQGAYKSIKEAYQK